MTSPGKIPPPYSLLKTLLITTTTTIPLTSYRFLLRNPKKSAVWSCIIMMAIGALIQYKRRLRERCEEMLGEDVMGKNHNKMRNSRSGSHATTTTTTEEDIATQQKMTQQKDKIESDNRGADASGNAVTAAGVTKSKAAAASLHVDTSTKAASSSEKQSEKELEKKQSESTASATTTTAKSRASHKRRLSKTKFYHQLAFLLRIVIPGWKSKEAFILLCHTFFLISRTFLSIYIAWLDGKIIKSIVDRKGTSFAKRVSHWLLVAIPASYVNSMIKYFESRLSVAFRSRLSEYAYEKYMRDQTYYRVTNMDGRLKNPDQCLTTDIEAFASHLAHVHSQLSKPILDIVMNTYQLMSMALNRGHGTGLPSMAISMGVVFLTSKGLKWVRPPIGRLVAKSAQLEGELRYTHSRLITHSEEIAFHKGAKVEKSILRDAYWRLTNFQKKFFRLKIFYNMCESYLMKYFWSASGLLMLAVPALLNEKEGGTPTGEMISNRTADFVTAKGLLLSAADAVERIMLSIKEIASLSGYTSRVYTMLKVFKQVSEQHYEKKSVVGSRSHTLSPHNVKIDVTDIQGKKTYADRVAFFDVPIVTPNGDVLAEHVSFCIEKGMHTIVVGGNGCGKSSLFRIAASLWPVYRGRIEVPHNLLYVSQRPYLVSGTLRDQITYPETWEDMNRKGITDEDLEDIMKKCHLSKLVRKWGWDQKMDWQNTLSGGEKQRLSFGRLYYHQPAFVVLDEAVANVSVDVEESLYSQCLELGMTVISISHRPSLYKYHKMILHFDGKGGVQFEELDQEQRTGLRSEKEKLLEEIQHIDEKKQRLRELCRILGEEFQY